MPRPVTYPPRKPLRIRLTIDSGLASYVRAWVKGIGFQNNERDAIVYLLRNSLVKKWESEVFREMMMPHLPKDIQRAWKRK